MLRSGIAMTTTTSRVRFFKDDGIDDAGQLKRVSSAERLPLNPHQTAKIISTAIKNLSIQQQEQDANEDNSDANSVDASAPTVVIHDFPVPENKQIHFENVNELKREEEEIKAFMESSVGHHSNGKRHRPERLNWPSRSGLSSGQMTPVFPHTPEEVEAMERVWKEDGRHSIIDMLSALYGIILVVMGVAFPISQVISSQIPSSYYQGFYAYLFFMALFFFIYVYFQLKIQLSIPLAWKIQWDDFTRKFDCCSNEEEISVQSMPDHIFAYGTHMTKIMTNKLRAKLGRELDPTKSANFGSFYLRIGAIVFGVGSMIYSGLEFGQYFEESPNPNCHNVMMAITPAARMFFTFFQTYYVFLNAKLQILKNGHLLIARFGLMHMTATNLCVWLNLIVQETKHEIMHFSEHQRGEHHGEGAVHDSENLASGGDGHHVTDAIQQMLNSTLAAIVSPMEDSNIVQHGGHINHAMVKREVEEECHRTNLMGTLTQNASSFLFPCAIEYSLICAAIMYEIWKHTGHSHGGHHEGGTTSHSRAESPSIGTPRTPGGSSHGSSRRSPHHYSVDCTNANRGLFFGIFILVLSIISMIIFLVLISRDEFKTLAIAEVHLSELILYMMTLAACFIGMIQVSSLRFNSSRKTDLDNLLLVVALIGVISFNIFTIIATQFTAHSDNLIIMVTALTGVLQGIIQTVFILDASKRQLYTRRQMNRKPGREVITFLMVTNFALWAITTMEKGRFDAHPVQSEFFGEWPWTIITNIASPLAIFFRYHSTVCLCEVWKRCYKVRITE